MATPAGNRRLVHSRGIVGFVLAAVGLVTPVVAAPAPAASAQSGNAALKVMTRNVYQGAELTPLFRVNSREELPPAVDRVFATVQATNFPERAEALADEIAESDPHLVGLQEAVLWRSAPADSNPTPNADVVEFDFLELLLDALATRGRQYTAVAVVENFDAEAPRPIGPDRFQDVRLTDRDAILVRTDLPAKVFSVGNVQAVNFKANLRFTHKVLGPIEVRRGWTAVDATVSGRTVRVVNTHLERTAPQIQVAQGDELLGGPADTPLPVVLLGDLNSAAGDGGVPNQSATETYGKMIKAGFTDTWTTTRGDEPGFTCCHAENLSNSTPTLTERIDLILVRGHIKPAGGAGHPPDARTPSGLWPSDHAGLRTVLHIGDSGGGPGH